MRVVILGPNLPRRFADTGTLHVHADGCADLAKYAGIPGEDRDWRVDVESILDIVADCYPPGDFDYELRSTGDGGRVPYETDLHIFPCVSGPLPYTDTENGGQ